MTHSEKVALALEDLSARGIAKATAAPPLFRLAWKLGVKLPPPLFLRFSELAAITGVPFGLFWGGFMWLTLWRRQGMPLGGAVITSAFAGVLFGAAMAGVLRWRARKLGLPRWTDYGASGSGTGSASR